MSGLTIYFTQEEAAVRALEAGADQLLKPADVDAAFRGVREAVKSGRLTEQRVEESARKILAAKYDLGLVKQRVAPVDAIDRHCFEQRRDVSLRWRLPNMRSRFVRDEDKLVPLRESETGCARCSTGDHKRRRSRLDCKCVCLANQVVVAESLKQLCLDERSSEQEVQKAIERAKSADLVIASLYGRVRSGQARSVGLPDPGARALSAVIETKVQTSGN